MTPDDAMLQGARHTEGGTVALTIAITLLAGFALSWWLLW